MSNATYLSKFRNLADISSSLNGNLHDNSISSIVCELSHGTPDLNASGLSASQLKKVDENAHELYLALDFINKSDKGRYGSLQKELENDYTKGKNNYPANLVKAFQILNNFRVFTSSSYREKPITGVDFAQRNDTKNNSSLKSKGNNTNKEISQPSDKECFGCGAPCISVFKCDYVRQCREKDKANRQKAAEKK